MNETVPPLARTARVIASITRAPLPDVQEILRLKNVKPVAIADDVLLYPREAVDIVRQSLAEADARKARKNVKPVAIADPREALAEADARKEARNG